MKTNNRKQSGNITDLRTANTMQHMAAYAQSEISGAVGDFKAAVGIDTTPVVNGKTIFGTRTGPSAMTLATDELRTQLNERSAGALPTSIDAILTQTEIKRPKK